MGQLGEVMRIYVGHSRSFDFKTDLYAPLKELNLAGMEFIFPHDEDEKYNSIERMKSYDLMIAEVSFPSIGLGVEMGWAEVLGVPVVLVHKKGQIVSDSLRLEFKDFLYYSNGVELKEKLGQYLEKFKKEKVLHEVEQ